MKNLKLFIFCNVLFLKFAAQGQASFTIQTDKPIADVASTMWGIFFEDINLGADGGIYAELIKNRSFEFTKPLMGWKITRPKTSTYSDFIASDILVVNQQEQNKINPHFIRVTLKNHKKGDLGLQNEGFRGIGIKKDLRYDFSVLYRTNPASFKNLRGLEPKMHLELVSEKGETIGSGVFEPNLVGLDLTWQKGETSFVATATDSKAKFNIWFEGTGVIDLDFISLFPTDTWKGRKGGLRADMIQILADMKPGFIRFPGGCIVEGFNLAQRYQWKNTIGKVEDRQLVINRWNTEIANRQTPDYYQTFGLGFFEYFQMAEDIGAAPLPIVNCGMACQFNTCEIVPIEQIGPYVQDALDLIEFANGSAISKWGKKRADMGHPLPFNLKMMGIGNENWGPQYLERLGIFQKAIKAKYPDMKLVCSSGVFPDESFNFLDSAVRKMKGEFFDEHYYQNPQWFLDNTHRYDSYDRKSATKVFAGEYAAQSDHVVSIENKNNWRTAIAEAAFMTGLERNADVVNMASYAPLFAHVDGWQWTPNLIWVDNLRSFGSANYQVQKMFSTNKGTQIVPINHEPLLGNCIPKPKVQSSNLDSLYASSTIDKNSSEVIIKIVNALGKSQAIEINLVGNKQISSTARVFVLQNDNLEAVNSLDNPMVVAPKEQTIEIKGKKISLNLAAYSFSIFKIKLNE